MKAVVFLFLSIIVFADSKPKLNGKSIYTKNGCYGCHGSDAKGGLTYPRLANQNKAYLIKKLKEYKKGNINSNRALMMKPYAKKLSLQEIEALGEYLSKMPKEKNEKRYYQEFEVGDSAGS